MSPVKLDQVVQEVKQELEEKSVKVDKDIIAQEVRDTLKSCGITNIEDMKKDILEQLVKAVTNKVENNGHKEGDRNNGNKDTKSVDNQSADEQRTSGTFIDEILH